MTVVALLADPPRPGLALPDLVDAGFCSPEAAADLYGALVQDAAVAVARSGGDLLVNYPPAEDVADAPAGPDAAAGEADPDPEAELRTVVGAALEHVGEVDVEDVRYEVQVGSTPAARVGNTVTHVLESEAASSAAVLRPEAPLIDRTVVDGAAMKLRRDEVVVGPAPGGRVYYAGFTEPIDFADALAPPAVETLAARAADAGLGVGFEAMHPLLERSHDLETVAPLLRARRRASQPVPAATVAVLERIDARFDPESDGS